MFISQFPNLQGSTQDSDTFDLYEYLDYSWGLVFMHPADFTPVCTTELGRAANLADEFEKRNVKLCGFSCNDGDSHKVNSWCGKPPLVERTFRNTLRLISHRSLLLSLWWQGWIEDIKCATGGEVTLWVWFWLLPITCHSGTFMDETYTLSFYTRILVHCFAIQIENTQSSWEW